MPMQEMDVELGHESVALCRSLRLEVTDGVPRGAVNPGRFYLFILMMFFFLKTRPSNAKDPWSKGGKTDVQTSVIMLI